MAVIKCSNCENEILDNEIVCPYCDCPLSETIKKMKNDVLANYSTKSVDDLTGRIPAIKEEEPPLATSSDFEKEKAAILKDININAEKAQKEETATGDDTDQLGKTVKISREEILNGKLKSDTKSETAVKEKTSTVKKDKTSSKSGKKAKRKAETKYIVLAITVIGVILIALLISKITDTISDGISRTKKVNKTVTVTSSAEEIAQEQGYTFSSSTLTITDEKVMKDYDSPEDTPWYQYKNTVKHITISDGVTKIGARAFEGFKHITDVTFSKSVTVVGDFAFYNCTSLKKLRLPDKNELMEIGKSAFELCENLELVSGYTKEANFEPSVISIGDRAFAHCSAFTEFKLPDDVNLGEDIFVGCSDDFAIVCSDSGNAYDYATQNDIPMKRDFDMSIVEEETNTEEDETESETKNEESTTNSTEEKTSGNNGGTQSSTGTEGTTGGQSGEETGGNTSAETTTPPEQGQNQNSEATLAELSKKLTEATTTEEQQKILEEMEKYY